MYVSIVVVVHSIYSGSLINSFCVTVCAVCAWGGYTLMSGGWSADNGPLVLRVQRVSFFKQKPQLLSFLSIHCCLNCGMIIRRMIRHEKDTPFVLFALSFCPFCQSLFFIFIIARFTFDDFKCNDDCQVVNLKLGGQMTLLLVIPMVSLI
jgi:hypothetical protein